MISRIRSVRLLTLTFFALLVLPGFMSAATTQAWLLISGDWKDSLMSTDPKERDMLEQGGWKLSGTGNLQSASQKNAVPLRRLARSGTDATDRMLETDAAKVPAHVKAGFTDEGVLGYVSSEGKSGFVAVHHFTRDNKHFWAIAPADQAKAKEMGWKPSGISFWLWPVSTPSEPATKASAKPAAKS